MTALTLPQITAELTGEQVIIDCVHVWIRNGETARDTGSPTPYAAGTLAHSLAITGWVKRDLQLCLARSNPRYRASQLAFGTITQEGIDGAYGFEKHSPLVAA